MTREPQTVTPETLLADAVNTLLSNRIGGLPVVEDGKLVGILTERDVLRACVDLLGRP
jgi:CBS domain-containing protein